MLGLFIMLSAVAVEPSEMRYLRPAGDKFVLESEVKITHDKGQSLYTSKTQRGKSALTLRVTRDKDGHIVNAEVSNDVSGTITTAKLERHGDVFRLTRGDATEEFKAPVDAIVTSVPDWSDVFALARRYNHTKKGKQEFAGIWFHPKEKTLTPTFSIELKGSDKVTVKGKEIVLHQFEVRLRSSAYRVWALPDSGTVVKIQTSGGTNPIVLEGYEEATQTLKATTGPLVIGGHDGWIGAIAFSPDSRTLASGGSDRMICLGELTEGKKCSRLEGHTDYVSALAFSPDGQTLASGSYDGTVRFWDVKTGKELGAGKAYGVRKEHRGTVNSVAFSPDGKQVASGGIDGIIRLWDAQSQKVVAKLEGHTSWVNGLVFSSDGKQLVSGSSDTSVRVWDVATRKEVKAFRVKDGEVRSVAVSPDGSLIAAGLRYGKARVWDKEKGKEVAVLDAHKGDAWGLAFAPNGKSLYTGGGDWKEPGEVHRWLIDGWKKDQTWKHTGEVLNLAVSPDGKHIAAGSWDRTTRVWPTNEGK